MKLTISTWVILGCFVTVSADQPVRVFDPPKVPEDARLGPPVHLDRPVAFRPAFETKEQWEHRANELRQQILVSLGLWPMPPKMPLNPTIHGNIDRDDYTIEKVFFASYPGHYVTGNLYRPKGKAGKVPAVLMPHGHWSNGRFVEMDEKHIKRELDSEAEKTEAGAKYPLQARAAMMARMGCVVFQFDMVGYADSKQIAHNHGFADVDAELRLQNFMGLQTWNCIRALDFLCELPEVDSQRLGVTGASGGGTQTFLLCAIDDRPAVSFPAVMVSGNMQGGCICENASLLRLGTNNIELAALFAPKPQAMTGAQDWTRDIETKGLPELRTIYGLYGAEDRISARYFPFPHNYNQVSREMMYNWLNEHLQLGFDSPISEGPFVPVSPADLSVYNDEFPRPSDATGAAELRKYLTSISDQQMAKLADSPDEYREIVGTALRTMIHDQLPRKGTVHPSNFKSIQRDGYAIHLSTLGRKGEDDQVPGFGLVPGKFSGNIVVWAHPDGKSGLLNDNGEPLPPVRKLLEKGFAVSCSDLFLIGEYHLPDKRTPLPRLRQRNHRTVPFAGYHYGYNPSLFAHRVHDLLTVISFAKHELGAKKVYLIGQGKAGAWALTAHALAGDVVNKAAIDVNGFEFNQIGELFGEMMLPGAVKYGGIKGLLGLCDKEKTKVWNLEKVDVSQPIDEQIGWLLQ